jgi:amidase
MSVEELLWQRDATGQAQAVRAGEVSALELVNAAISRAERTGGEINAIAERLHETARAQASTATGPLAGVPTVFKDLGLSLDDVPTHSGSQMMPRKPGWTSTLAARWQAAGLIAIATSTTSEWGLRIVTETEKFGLTRNPWSTGHVTGGSSGGSAALVAAGVVAVAHASDGGGSIRIPAACCGLVGLKPSRGRVPMTPDLREGWNGFVVQHAVTRSVRDCAALLDVALAGVDPLAPYLPPLTEESYSTAAASTPKQLKLGVFQRNPLGLPTEPEALSALEIAAQACRDAGHMVEDIDIPAVTRAMITDFCMSVAANHAGNMAQEAARTGPYGLSRAGRQARIMARFGNSLRGGEVTSAGMRLQGAAMNIISQTMGYDAVLMPIISAPPVPCRGLDPTGMDALAEDILDRLRLSALLRRPKLLARMIDKSLWFAPWPAIQNITGQPAIALPVHVTAQGLPLGIQAVGRSGDEGTLLALAAQLEDAIGWRDRRAPLMPPE